MNIYVGNLSYETQDSDLNHAFSAFGAVDSARVVMDREMGNSSEANRAIQELNGKDLQQRAIKVNEAKPRESRPARY